MSSAVDAIREIEALEDEARHLESRRAELFRQLEATQVFRGDGHGTAKTMLRHVARLSGPSAARWQRIGRVTRDLSLVAEALTDGRIGVDQVDLLGRVHSNVRVRDFMVDAQDWFLEMASRPFDDFETAVREWERLADENGPEPNDRMHQARRVKLTQDDQSLTWTLDGRFGSMMGAQIDEIFAHYTAAELHADWEKARAEHGDDACDAHLPRSADQRSADALWQVFQDAASADTSCVPPDFCHDIVWNADTYETMLRRLEGEPVAPLDPETFDAKPSPAHPSNPTKPPPIRSWHRSDESSSTRPAPSSTSDAPEPSPARPARPPSCKPNTVSGPDAESPSIDARSTTPTATPTAAEPTPATGHHSADATTEERNTTTRCGATPPANGARTDPTAPKSRTETAPSGRFGAPGRATR
ncbi:MAG: DUF222 domain-containing protein [Actinomycetota bacterium]